MKKTLMFVLAAEICLCLALLFGGIVVGRIWAFNEFKAVTNPPPVTEGLEISSYTEGYHKATKDLEEMMAECPYEGKVETVSAE